ncbi:MAG TPA: Fur family transcriptional regulator [Thermodesulfovibrionales bacterium]|nr:Fur family transcriptional regulator [Thermodesulfovibrionales bacterium]
METRIFREYLSKKGLRFTKERERILKEIFAFHGHFDPEELLLNIRNKKRKVSKASIYRTLPLLVESGLIEQVEKIGKHAHYEHTFGHGHHDHCICVNCGAVIEVFSPKLEAIQEELCKEAGFSGIKHTLEIKGYCGDCRREE